MTDWESRMVVISSHRPYRAFTIVELIVVVAVIGVLVTVGVISYGAWQQSVARTQVRSALLAGAGGMETERNFGGGYPTSVPAEYRNADGVTITGGSPDNGKSFCLDGVSVKDPTVTLYVDERNPKEPQVGTCATRTFDILPNAPTNLLATLATGSSIALSWTGVAGGPTYTTQCASDPGYIYNMKEIKTTSTSVTHTNLTPSAQYYCRVRAATTVGQGGWSASTLATTLTSYGSLPVATSLEGWWKTPPNGFLFEDGSAVSRTAYSDLFAAIGTTFGGGDGSTTFNLPDSRGRTGVTQSGVDSEFSAVGQKYGEKAHLLTIAEMPSHNHGQYTGTRDDGNFSGWNFGTYPQYPPGDGPGVGLHPLSMGTTGGNLPHNEIQPSIVKLSVIKYAPVDAAAQTLPAGTSISGYWQSIPSGYVAENGQAISRTTYNDLFNVVGTTYGTGNGSTTFNVPNSQGRVGVPISAADTEFDTLNEQGGSKTEVLTVAQLPSHTHTMYIGQPDDQNFGNSPGQYPPGDGPGTNNTGITTTATGGGGAHNNIQPSITKRYLIKTTPSTGTGESMPTGSTLSGWWTSATPPSGYLEENGQTVSRTTYAALFGVIGTTYGAGNGSTTFQLPDSRGRVSVNLSPFDTEFNTIGKKIGTKTHILTIPEMPAHTHGQYHGGIDDKNFTSGAGQVPPGDGPGMYSQGHIFMPTGSDQAHNNLQRYIVKRSFIKI